jgi:hypothetical protein
VDGLNAASGRLDLSLSVSGTSGGAPATLAEPSFANNTAIIRVTGTPNFTYTVEISSNLIDWTALGTVTMDATGASSFSQPNSPSDHAFYRTR